MVFRYSQLFLEMAARVKAQAPDLAVELAANLEYLAKFGRAATLPEVGPIRGSAYGDNCIEVRTSLEPANEQAPHLRTIGYFAPDDETIFLAVCGDKKGSWDEWYQRAIPTADGIYAEFLKAEGWAE